MQKLPRWTHQIVGGHLCLDFLNTADWHGSPREIELLAGYGEFIAWAAAVRIATRPEGAALLRSAQQEPAKAEYAVREAIQLREDMFAIFRPLALGENPGSDVLDEWTSIYRDWLGATRLVPARNAMHRVWNGAPSDLKRLLLPIVLSTEELLVHGPLDRIRICGMEDCGWMFLDRSRAGRRAWCNMKTCGNRAKARRFYSRQHARVGRATIIGEEAL